MINCENCYHFDVCKNYLAELGYTLGVDYKATRCPFYKDKSSLIERKALYEKVEQLLIGHGYINPDAAIIECLEIIENFPTADVERERERRLTMKEKLIKLLLSAEKVADEAGFFNCHKSRPKAELIADYLIENGVIVPLCKVGDEVYNIESLSIRTLKVVSIHLSDEGSIRHKKYKSHFVAIETNSKMNGKFKLDSFGITTFKTYEEAEKKLKERENK